MNSAKNCITIDTKEYREIKPPGLVAPRNKISYYHPQVQEMLTEAFSRIFPSIIASDEGIAYQLLDQRGRDRCVKSEPAKNLADIPKGELLKLMEGWIRLRRRIQDLELEKTVESILLNFRVPDPRKAIELYRIETIGDTKKLIIFWGFETANKPCLSIERALSILLDVPVCHLQSILSTSISPSTSGITKTTRLDSETFELIAQKARGVEPQGSGGDLKNKKASRVWVAALIIIGALLAGSTFLFTSQKEDVVKTQYVSSLGVTNDIEKTAQKDELNAEVVANDGVLEVMAEGGESSSQQMVKSDDLLSEMLQASKSNASREDESMSVQSMLSKQKTY